MADGTNRDDLERSEEATPKRREEARGKGQFPRSRILIPAATLVAIAVALHFGGALLLNGLERCVVGFINEAGNLHVLAADEFLNLSGQAGLLLAPALLPFFAAVSAAALAFGFVQSGMVLAAEPLRVDFSRINPLTGLGRLFSLDSVGELMKSVLLLLGLGGLGVAFIYADLKQLTALSGLGAAEIFSYASRRGAALIGWTVGASGALAGLDFLYQRWRTEAQLRMSRQEVKEEMREQEGDPQLKGRLKSLRQKMSRRRMSVEVAKADVVITNPTHLAVALRYRTGESGAPRVLGKGAGFIAEKIREIARANGIAIVENKPLARLLYQQVEVGREIPEKLYRAVAEVLAYVYRLRRGERGGPAKSGAAQS
jgi:flagellar biosynthetic protein FlhB